MTDVAPFAGGHNQELALADLILHHFDASPFAEKVRLALGLKNLDWKSVQIPMVMPKPELMPLTGGYRKTPVLQIGAEVFCDTRLIIEELEQRFPDPTIAPYGEMGLAQALFSWSDKTFFEPGAALSMGLNTEIPEPLLNDRKAFFNFMDFDELQSAAPHMYTQFLAQLELLESQLSDGREYLLGAKPGLVDVAGFFPLWMARGNFPQVKDWLDPYAHLLRWEARMQQVGHGRPEEIPAAQALAIARESSPAAGQGVGADPLGLEVGQRVSVAPTDYGAVPVVGELVSLSRRRVSLQREDAATGPVNTHFPRAGYRISPA